MQLDQQGWTEFHNVDIKGNGSTYVFYGLVDTLTATNANIDIVSGARLTGANISGGTLRVYGDSAGIGASVSNIIIEKDGQTTIYRANNGIYGADVYGKLTVADGGSTNLSFASDLTVYSGGEVDFLTGTRASGTIALQNGATLRQSGGLVDNGGVIDVQSGAAFTMTGGGVNGIAGNITSGLVVNGGTANINNGYVYATVMTGALNVKDTGIISGAALSGGELYAGAGGTVYDAIVNGGVLRVGNVGSSGGVASGVDLKTVGVVVQSGGKVYGVVVSGGILHCRDYGSAFNVDVLSGGQIYVSAHSYVSGLNISGGTERTTIFGAVEKLTASNAEVHIAAGATVNGLDTTAEAIVNISSGGVVNMFEGNEATGINVLTSGTLSVSGGVASSLTVGDDGKLNTYTGGAVSGLALNDGYASINGGVVSGAVLSGTAIASTGDERGKLNVRSGATVTDTVVSYGGLLVFEKGGGTANGLTTVYSGGMVKVTENGTIDKLDLVTDADYDFGTGTATEYTINGNALLDGKYFSGDTAYVLDAAN
ncbi:MAG: hypothetical protein PHI35_05185, partial [Victivallaceae bacterium]|nr:hypothetical protein [Victivallaceae bacterium]